MTSVVYYCAASLDGYIADACDAIEWLTDYQGEYAGAGVEPIKGAYERFYGGVGALVIGSATYEFLLGAVGQGMEWPYKDKPCWILTSRRRQMPAGESLDLRFVDARVSDVFDEMIASARQRRLWIVGGGNVASQFAEQNLLDEVRVHVVPVVLGRGKQLFEHRLPGPAMQLTGVCPRDNGMVELCYEIRREHGS
jgi:dihydrofolate reductase